MNTRFHWVFWALLGAGFWAAANPLPVDPFGESPTVLDTNLAERVLSTKRTGRPALSATNTPISLVLMMQFGDVGTNNVGVNASQGILVAPDGLTNHIEVLAAEDKSAMVLVTYENPAVYATTNFGLSWSVARAAGTNNFPLTAGFYAQAVLGGEASNALVFTNWSAASSANDGTRLFLREDARGPVPAVSVIPSGVNSTAAWPAQLGNFILQSASDLSGTNGVEVPGNISTNHGECEMSVPGAGETNFYRLIPAPH